MQTKNEKQNNDENLTYTLKLNKNKTRAKQKFNNNMELNEK